MSAEPKSQVEKVRARKVFRHGLCERIIAEKDRQLIELRTELAEVKKQLSTKQALHKSLAEGMVAVRREDLKRALNYLPVERQLSERYYQSIDRLKAALA